eukprot:m.82120 g.82120  ORF g.82120 m.82120 type:complete len:74 (+) comp8253_c0_seq1:98-319(+)
MAVQLFERGQYQQCLALLAANLPSTESAVAAPQSAAEAIVHESAVLACHTAVCDPFLGSHSALKSLTRPPGSL